MENAYATALWKIIEKGMKPADAVAALHHKLITEGRVALLPRIARAFARLAATQESRNAVTLTVADLRHEHDAKKAVAALGIEVPSATTVDPTLIGGWRLESPESLVDASYKKHLLAIYRAATNA